ncbi:MAG TPA: hypothetical protein VNQ52_09985 [Microbacteriaceae bacterium]|nr:hypothetical protein [Microbacteriaceae bacterium]
MRSYIFNPAVIGAVAGVIPAIRQSVRGPRDWRLALVWVGWGINVAIAVGTVVEHNRLEREAQTRAELGLSEDIGV